MRSYNVAGRNPRNVFTAPATPADHLTALVDWLQAEAPEVLVAYQEAQGNPDNVLTPSPSPFSGAHFATFPESLITNLIKASCPAKTCPLCGAGFAPVVEQKTVAPSDRPTKKPIRFLAASKNGQGTNGTGESTLGMIQQTTTHGYLPTCTHYCTCSEPSCVVLEPSALLCAVCDKLHPAFSQPGVVCDPFGGSGTTALVARALGRQVVIVEASPTYTQLARKRLGLADLAAWEGTVPEDIPAESFDDLPLFGSQ